MGDVREVYMYFQGFRLREGVSPERAVGVLGEFVSGFNGSWEGSLRGYVAVSGPAHLVLWGYSGSMDGIVELRLSSLSRLGGLLEESFSWPSIFKPSPYAPLEHYKSSLRNLEAEPLPYLVVYPMKKSPEWYLVPEGERRAVMGEHIRIARTHPASRGVRSYTTYSFGIADYEFLVIYELEDVSSWIEVVEALRQAKARKWIVREDPVILAKRLG